MIVLETGLADEGVFAGLESDGRDVVVADDAFVVHVHVTLWPFFLLVLLLRLERCCFDLLFLWCCFTPCSSW